MAENVAADPVGTPPEDNRPHPRYGELAPVGWTWEPPVDEVAEAPESTQSPLKAEKVAKAEKAAKVAKAEAADATTADKGAGGRFSGTAPLWDRPVTLGLLVIGLLSTFYGIAQLIGLPDLMPGLYDQLGVEGAYAPGPAVAALTMVGSVLEAGVWLAAAWFSVHLIMRNRRAFIVPLVGAVLSFVTLYVFMAALMLTDPTMLEFFKNVSSGS